MTRLAWGCSILALLAVIACTAPPSVPDTVSSSSEFTLAIASQRPVYYSTEVIRISAVATYVGEASGVEIWGRGTPVEFLLEEVGGPRRMGAGPRGLPCTMTGLRVGESLTVPFVKSRGSPNNPTQGFDAAWLDDPQLRLPAGRWRVIALFHPLRRGCDSVIHDLDAGLEILVQQ